VVKKMSLIEACNLSKIYENRIQALKDLSFSINKGEIVGVIGESGSGKTTLLNILSGLDKPTHGIIYYNGNVLNDMSNKQLAILRRREFGYIFQFFNLIRFLNVIENIALPTVFDGKLIDNNLLDTILKDLGIYQKRLSYPDELSGGEKQRVAIARAISYNPSVIFADEPTGNLDTKASQNIINIILQTAQKNKQTLILATHDTTLYKYFNKTIELIKS
jgi:putative ABC transport system ATP-binding protein